MTDLVKFAATLTIGFLALAAPVATAAVEPVPPGGEVGELGVVVMRVAWASTAEKVGIEPDDTILLWERMPSFPGDPEGERGMIRSVFDWYWLAIEQAQRASLKLTVVREDEVRNVWLPRGSLEIEVRQKLADQDLEAFMEGDRLVHDDRAEEGVRLWKRLAEDGSERLNSHTLCWLLLKIGDVRLRQGRTANAVEAYDKALATAPDNRSRAEVLDSLGHLYLETEDFDKASQLYGDALDLRRREQAESLMVAESLSFLASLAWVRGDVSELERLVREALRLRGALAPGSPDHGVSLDNMGHVHYLKGELAEAQEYLQKSLEIVQRTEPGSLSEAESLNNMGLLMVDRGDLESAEAYFERALSIYKFLDPKNEEMYNTLANLGVVAAHRRDVSLAIYYFEMVLAKGKDLGISRKTQAGLLTNLGAMYVARGDAAAFRKAALYLWKALEIREEIEPGSVYHAEVFGNLGSLAHSRGRLDEAEEMFTRALEIGRSGSADRNVANHLSGLCDVLAQGRKLEEAEKRCSDGLGLVRETDVSVKERLLQILGRIARQREDLERAADYYRQAIDVRELRQGRLGGDFEASIAFRVDNGDVYKEYVEILVDLGREKEAFMTLERYHSGILSGMLTQRDVGLGGLPPEVDEVRRRLDHEYDRVFKRVASLAHGDAAQEEALRELRHLRSERQRMERNFRGYKAGKILSRGQGLAFDDVARGVAPKTSLISYCVGEERTLVFVLSGNGDLSVRSIPQGRKDLQDQVGAFRDLVKNSRPGTSLSELRGKGLVELSNAMYELLLGPDEGLLEGSERMFIVPDAPLYYLPFGALVRRVASNDPRTATQFLAEWKPFQVILSAAMHDGNDSAENGSQVQGLQLLAFADPGFQKAREEDERAPHLPETATERSLETFGELPYARREVEEIASLYEPQEVETLFGDDASEEKAKSIKQKLRSLHFATHGFFQDRSPLDSGLVLTRSGERDNGLLQAWEIFESVRIDADLVILSACESALGEKQGGEGLVGLTQAFLYAGAHAVIASLWNVNDRGTAELMKRFYRHWRDGLDEDEALRAAQVELIEGPFSSPYYWAAFQVYGNWK